MITSKVVNDYGEPLIVFHGTQRKFKHFALPSYYGKAKYATDGGAEMGMSGQGIFFTSNEAAAITYSELHKRKKKNNRVIKAHILIENAYIIDAKGATWTGRIADNYKLGLRSKKHDGVIIKNVIDSANNEKLLGTVYIVKSTSQIKQIN